MGIGGGVASFGQAIGVAPRREGRHNALAYNVMTWFRCSVGAFVTRSFEGAAVQQRSPQIHHGE